MVSVAGPKRNPHNPLRVLCRLEVGGLQGGYFAYRKELQAWKTNQLGHWFTHARMLGGIVDD